MILIGLILIYLFISEGKELIEESEEESEEENYSEKELDEDFHKKKGEIFSDTEEPEQEIENVEGDVEAKNTIEVVQ